MFARSAMLLPGSPAAPACCSALYLHDEHADFELIVCVQTSTLTTARMMSSHAYKHNVVQLM